MLKVCNRGDALGRVATITWITTGVFAAASITFATLLFVRKNDSEKVARLKRRGFHLGAAPLHRSGVIVGGGARF